MSRLKRLYRRGSRKRWLGKAADWSDVIPRAAGSVLWGAGRHARAAFPLLTGPAVSTPVALSTPRRSRVHFSRLRRLPNESPPRDSNPEILPSYIRIFFLLVQWRLFEKCFEPREFNRPEQVFFQHSAWYVSPVFRERGGPTREN